jgi:putative ABC transport system permease protein
MNLFKLVSKNLLRSKGRFIFTLLGITIGMASFVALLSLGGNMRREVTSQAYNLGGSFVIVPDDLCVYNQIGIITGDAISETLDYTAYERIKEIDGIEVIPHLTRRMSVFNASAAGGDGAFQPTTVTGILPAETKAFREWEMHEGEYFASQDEEAIVIGMGIANRFNLGVGDVLTVRPEEEFTIKGIIANTSSNDDTTIHLPLSVAQRVFDREDLVSYMTAKIEDMSKFEEYSAAIIGLANVNVTTNEQLLNSVLSILASVNVTLQMVAGVALIAAAFGIINTMMTAVYERRREIGIMRAIGGRRASIFKIFITEAGIYGLLGGIVGVLVGVAVSEIAAPIVARNNEMMLKGVEMGSNIDIALIATAISFSIVISVLSGLYPAWKAAKLTPVEAISYE